MSGALHHLGLFVPGPFLGANESNPKGFFESRWAVKFHRAIIDEAGIDTFDSRPEAFARVQEFLTPERRHRLAQFLRKQSAKGAQVVVKDPRSVWTQGLWRDAAADAGLAIGYVTMLRHPAEVVGSRTTYYASNANADKQWRYQVFNVARWINSSLISERETRGRARVFVRYADLLGDWRAPMQTVAEKLALEYSVDITSAEHNHVDDFIDPGLRRHTATWEDLSVPASLQGLAQDVWDELQRLVLDPSDPEASARLDELSVRFDRLLAEAAAISHDVVAAARRKATTEAQSQLEPQRAATRPQTAASQPAGSGLAEIRTLDLARTVGRRVMDRAARRHR